MGNNIVFSYRVRSCKIVYYPGNGYGYGYGYGCGCGYGYGYGYDYGEV